MDEKQITSTATEGLLSSTEIRAVMDAREITISRLCAIAEQGIRGARRHLELDWHFMPLVVAVYDAPALPRVITPRFGNEAERDEVYEEINQVLELTGASGVVAIAESWWNPGEGQCLCEALVTTVHALGHHQLLVLPFTRDGSKIQWDEPLPAQTSFTDPFLWVFGRRRVH